MKEKDIRRLRRKDLLKIIVGLSQENDALKNQIEELMQKKLNMENAGSMADAAMQIYGVFDAADSAAKTYLDNIEFMQSEGAVKLKETQEKCERMLREMESECQALKEKAKAEADEYWEETTLRIEAYFNAQQDLIDYMDKGIQGKIFKR